ncbi:methylaspartate mutase [Streptomyces sp. NPDC048665]|uniref:methylaspartate mutase n=1 Tax=unclassified Streptomyces TaxID=2593676 RepID=UPI003437E076
MKAVQPAGVPAIAPAFGRFSRFVRRSREEGRLVVQPRMGFADTATMRRGLEAVRAVRAASVGTVTVDSYTRVNDHASARRALERGDDLNGYPVVAHGEEETRRLLAGVADDDFPVQFRHGSALPRDLFGTLARVGADATEGGPVSYCLPYSRVPLPQATAAWAECCRILADRPEPMHLESFGGCMLGQLCPPSLLIALSVLEGMFFREHGMRSISVSYAQQTSPQQDLEALAALRRLAAQWLGDDVDWHVVLYTYMGVFPRTPVGAYRMLEDSVRLAVRSGTERLIVKTAVEAYRIPTIEENVDALEFAAAVEADERRRAPAAGPVQQTGIYEEALRLITSTLRFGDDVGSALVGAFAHGHLDVPYCLHQDNANRSRAAIDPRGTLRWSHPGAMPVAASGGHGTAEVTARSLIDMLGYNERRFDREELVGAAVRGML